uniref:TLDc domain-containing protein n=1 Tax=Caenorhabditis tropicalis TaxID=1561998 RepID=A0A1I7U4Z7_9PELO
MENDLQFINCDASFRCRAWRNRRACTSSTPDTFFFFILPEHYYLVFRINDNDLHVSMGASTSKNMCFGDISRALS